MESIKLLPELSKLPTDDTKQRSTRELMQHLLANDAALFASEFTASVSIGLWGIWDQINVPDAITAAYAAQYPKLAADHSLYDQWQAMQELGPESTAGFINGLKGKLAEINAAEQLDSRGFTNVILAANPVQDTWDISAINQAGEPVLFQVKTGSADYSRSVNAEMESAPNIDFLISSELYDQISQASPQLMNRITDVGSDFERASGIEDGLNVLGNNLGIDMPDKIGEILPYVGSILSGLNLIITAVKAEGEFSDADRTSTNKIHVIQTLMLLSRFGINTTLAAVGGMAGAVAGSAIPLFGTLTLGAASSVATVLWAGPKLNQRAAPHLLDLALNITRLTKDDLFYFKNKSKIDELAFSFRKTANGFEQNSSE